MGPGTGNGRGAGLSDRCTGAWKSVHSSDPLQSLLGAWAKLSTDGPRRVVRGKAGGLGQVVRGWLRSAGSGENQTRDYRRTASWPGHVLSSWGPGALLHSPSAPHMLLPRPRAEGLEDGTGPELRPHPLSLLSRFVCRK